MLQGMWFETSKEGARNGHEIEYFEQIYVIPLTVGTARVAWLPLRRRWVTARSPISVSFSSSSIVPFTWQDAEGRLRVGRMTWRKKGARLRWIKAGRRRRRFKPVFHNHQRNLLFGKKEWWGGQYDKTSLLAAEWIVLDFKVARWLHCGMIFPRTPKTGAQGGLMSRCYLADASVYFCC